MTLVQLRYFLGIAAAGTMSEAARQMGVAQPALSSHIAHLEAELGRALFIRHGRGMALTETGLRLQQRAGEILRQVELVTDELSSEDGSPSGTVAVGMATAANMAFSVDLFIATRRRLPRTTLQLVESMSGFLLEWVERARIDMAVVYDAMPQSALLVERLATERLYLIAGPELEDRPAVTFASLADLPLILPGKQHRLGQLILRRAAKQKVPLTIAAHIDSTYSIKKLVGRGEGYSILSAHAVREEVARGELRAIVIEAPALIRSIDLVINPLRRLNPSVAAVRRLLVEVVRDVPGFPV